MTERGQLRPSNDNADPNCGVNLKDDLVMGVRLYSRLPTGQSPHQRPNLDRVAYALPFTSLLIGLGPALLVLLLHRAGASALVAAGFGAVAMLVITGAMAEDALADAADGLFGGGTAEQRLAIMRDSRHGTYGVAALCSFLILRVALLAAALDAQPLAAAGLWLGATVLARSGALWLPLRLVAARTDGVSASAGRVRLAPFLTGAVLALVLAFILVAPFTSVRAFLLGIAAGLAVILLWTALCRHLVGGQTGDLIGAGQALLELFTFSTFILFVGR